MLYHYFINKMQNGFSSTGGKGRSPPKQMELLEMCYKKKVDGGWSGPRALEVAVSRYYFIKKINSCLKVLIILFVLQETFQKLLEDGQS